MCQSRTWTACKSLLQQSIPLIFCRGVYTPFCLLGVIHQVTNPHLFKVKGRNWGPVIANLFSVWPFSLENALAVEAQQSVLCGSFLSCLPGATLPSVLLTVPFLQPYETLWSHVSLESCIPQRNVCSEEVVSSLHSQVVCQVESCRLCRSKKKRFTEVFYLLYILCLLSRSKWGQVKCLS